MVVLDFTGCETVDDVNKKWLDYAEDIEPYKSLFKKLREENNDRKTQM